MDNIFNRPVIGVVMCRYRLNGHLTQTLQEKYLNAVITAGGLPIALPHALAEPEMLAELLPRLDGILLPGSPSNVQPHLYGENGDEPDADPGRDALSLALIRQAFDRRIPFSPFAAACRRWWSPPKAPCIAACTNCPSCRNTVKITTCRWNSNTPRPRSHRSGRRAAFATDTGLQQILGELAARPGCQNPGRERSHRGARRRRAGGGDQRARSAFRARRAVAPGVEQRRVRPVAPVV